MPTSSGVASFLGMSRLWIAQGLAVVAAATFWSVLDQPFLG